MNAIGYARTSTQKQDLSLEVQEKRLRAEAEYREFDFELIGEKVSGSVAPLERPGLSGALEKLRIGEANVLMVAKLDRVARSMGDIARLLEISKEQHWNFIALDLGVDTSSPEGTLVVGIMASIAQWERARIQERTREALTQAKANGKRLGRPRIHKADVALRAKQLHGEGLSLTKIASALYDEGFTSSKGTALVPSAILRLVK